MQKSLSGGNTILRQVGHAILTVDLPSNAKEEFLIMPPRPHIDDPRYCPPYMNDRAHQDVLHPDTD